MAGRARDAGLGRWRTPAGGCRGGAPVQSRTAFALGDAPAREPARADGGCPLHAPGAGPRGRHGACRHVAAAVSP
ncbi:hypothetical protein G6F35_017932 [Rhizopus arrhizus]|nr:hypothetical protein G6F35_017932 [Rhizopus arrhizus]